MAALSSDAIKPGIISIVTFSMHGFNHGRPMLDYLCNNLVADIILLQEHWKGTHNLNEILDFFHSYSGYGMSAMDNVLTKGILYGRPFGGACILIKKQFNSRATQLLFTDRSVIIQIGSFAFVNLYLPCKGKDFHYSDGECSLRNCQYYT